jgi:tetratricopeptide (TPR) repeat protein
MGDLIGRRKQLREGLKILRETGAAGLVLQGIGGIGKSALAGRMMLRLKEEGWIVAAVQGRLGAKDIAEELGDILLEYDEEKYAVKVKQLTSSSLDDDRRVKKICGILSTELVLLVMDDFEQNLAKKNDAFQDPQTKEVLSRFLLASTKGKLLITCRYPIPGNLPGLEAIHVPPLSDAEGRKLAMRLTSFDAMEAKDAARVHRLIGRHPRMLELLDALLKGGKARFNHIQRKFDELLAQEAINQDQNLDKLSDHLQQVLTLGMRDILLEALFDRVRVEGQHLALLQVAASNLPVTAEGLARMLAGRPVAGTPVAGSPEETTDVEAARKALSRFAALSLVFLDEDGEAWVHRWTAEGLAELEREAFKICCERAGDYRIWRVEHESQSLVDAVEAVRNYLAAEAYDKAYSSASGCLTAMKEFQQTYSVAMFASEVLETLPFDHLGFAGIADEEAMAYLALGNMNRAFQRYERLIEQYLNLVQTEPGEPFHSQILSMLYNKMGDLYRAWGEGEKAGEAYGNALAIRKRLAAREPDRADYQRDLSVSHERMGE